MVHAHSYESFNGPERIKPEGDRQAATSYCEKTDEDQDSVEYKYGVEPEDLSMVLSIDKKSMRPGEESDRIGLTGLMALSRIIRTYNERGEWPQRGASFI